MTSYLADMNTRAANGHSAFAELLAEIAGIDPATAIGVTNFYLRNKLAKLDRHIGRVIVKHGDFLDRDVILAAVASL